MPEPRLAVPCLDDAAAPPAPCLALVPAAHSPLEGNQHMSHPSCRSRHPASPSRPRPGSCDPTKCCPAGLCAGGQRHSRLVDAAVVENEVHRRKLLARLLRLQVELDHPLVSCNSGTGSVTRAPGQPNPGGPRRKKASPRTLPTAKGTAPAPTPAPPSPDALHGHHGTPAHCPSDRLPPTGGPPRCPGRPTRPHPGPV